MVEKIINRLKQYRNREMLQCLYNEEYAFIGVGAHAMQNLHPILQHLGIRLKYIVCRDRSKLSAISRRFGAIPTTDLDEVLNDETIRGVFICTTPQSHYSILQSVVQSGKYIFVEKPPCSSLTELNTLIGVDSAKKIMTGMQKRYSPYILTLKKRLRDKSVLSYSLIYRTGAYPEGNPLTDLFIHPIDMVIDIFGNAEITAIQVNQANGRETIQMMLRHKSTIGCLELSTAYSWTNASETLTVNTTTSTFLLDNMERLSVTPHPKTAVGIPLEKVGLYSNITETIQVRSNFSPTLRNNQLYTQGFYSEINAFVDMVESKHPNKSSLDSLSATYQLLEAIKKHIIQ